MNVNNSSHSMPENLHNAAGGNRLDGLDREQFCYKYRLCPNGRIKPICANGLKSSKRCLDLSKLAEQSQPDSSGPAWGKQVNFAGARQTSADIQLAIRQNIEGAGAKANHGNLSGSWVRLNHQISCSANGGHYVVWQNNIPVHFSMDEAGNMITCQAGSTAAKTKLSGQKEGGSQLTAVNLLAAQCALQSFLAQRHSVYSLSAPRLSHSGNPSLWDIAASRQTSSSASTSASSSASAAAKAPAKAVAAVPDSTSMLPDSASARRQSAGNSAWPMKLSTNV